MEKLFDRIDGLMLPDKRITMPELVEHFRGNTQEADKYMEMMDGFRNGREEDPDGFVDLDEFKEYFRFVAQEDTCNAETSPAACKALVALEYVPTPVDVATYAESKRPGAKGKLSAKVETTNFWPRVDTVFRIIDLKGDGNGEISRDELVEHFHGNNAEADYYIDRMGGFHEDGHHCIKPDQWFASDLKETCVHVVNSSRID